MKRATGYILLLFISILFGCVQNPENPGYQYYAEMDTAPVIAGHTQTPPFNDSTFRSIAREAHTSYALSEALTSSATKTAMYVSDPTQQYLTGQSLYLRLCQQCHGKTGSGDGWLVSSGKYPYTPASLTGERALNLTSLELALIIRDGYGVMGPHGAMLTDKELILLAQYIQKLQNR